MKGLMGIGVCRRCGKVKELIKKIRGVYICRECYHGTEENTMGGFKTRIKAEKARSRLGRKKFGKHSKTKVKGMIKKVRSLRPEKIEKALGFNKIGL